MIISDVNIFLGGRQTFQRTFNSQQDQFQANRQYSHDPTQHYRNEKPVYQASVSYTDFQTHEYTRETGPSSIWYLLCDTGNNMEIIYNTNVHTFPILYLCIVVCVFFSTEILLVLD